MIIEKVIPIKLDKADGVRYAKEIIAKYIKKSVKSVEYLGGGSFGRAYKTILSDGSCLVVKFLIADGLLDKEVGDLRLLGEKCMVKFPKVLFVHKKDDTVCVDCYGMELVEGKSALLAFDMLFMSKRKKLEFADKVTTALNSIHQHTSDKFGNALCPNCDEWLDYYKPFAKAVLDKAEELYRKNELSEKIIKTMQNAWDKFDVIFDEKVTKACLIHGDLNVANIMVNKNRTLAGFIDPLNSTYADVEYDLFQFDNLTGKRFYLRGTYIKKYGASKRCDAKCAFYGLWNEVFCYIKSGAMFSIIMNPLVKNMQKTLKKL